MNQGIRLQFRICSSCKSESIVGEFWQEPCLGCWNEEPGKERQVCPKCCAKEEVVKGLEFSFCKEHKDYPKEKVKKYAERILAKRRKKDVESFFR